MKVGVKYMKRSKHKKINLIKILFVLLIIFIIIFAIYKLVPTKNDTPQKVLMEDITNKELSYVKEYSDKYNLDLEINYDYSDTIPKDKVINQSILKKNISLFHFVFHILIKPLPIPGTLEI